MLNEYLTQALGIPQDKTHKKQRKQPTSEQKTPKTHTPKGIPKPETPKHPIRYTLSGNPVPTTEGNTLSYTCTCTHCGAKARLSFDLRENQLEARRLMYRAFGWVVEWEGCNRCSDCWQQTRHDKNHAKQHEEGRP